MSIRAGLAGAALEGALSGDVDQMKGALREMDDSELIELSSAVDALYPWLVAVRAVRISRTLNEEDL